MKNVIFTYITAVIYLFCSLPCSSQSENTQATDSEKNIIGTWQKCSIVKDQAGNEQVDIEPYIKTIYADGTYREISIRSEYTNRSINKAGEWEIINDSTYSEKAAGKTSTYKYSYYDAGKNIMISEFSAPETSKKEPSYWLRFKELQGVQKSIMEQPEENTAIVSPIIGTWQWQAVVTDKNGEERLKSHPVIKTINADGTYSTMIYYSNTTNGAISQVGKWEIINDSTYHEKIDKHINDKLDSSVSIINYSFTDEDKEVMRIEYTNSKLTNKASEVWQKFEPMKESTFKLK